MLVQITHGERVFTCDYAFDERTTQAHLYDTCVRTLVTGLFDGFNATIFAYGQARGMLHNSLPITTSLQTGSGKTFTMGTNWTGRMDDTAGVIPRVVGDIFDTVRQQRIALPETAFEIRTQFIEVQ